MSDGIEISNKSIASPKYDRHSPHPEYTSLQRSRRFNKGNSKQYQENYNKIDWSRDLSKTPEKPKVKDKYEQAFDILGEDFDSAIGHAIGYWYVESPSGTFDDELAVIMTDRLKEMAREKYEL